MSAARSRSFVRPAPGARARGGRARGYTAIEVLIAMTVMAIGAAAVMTMQKASIQGNYDARRLDVANGIARMWEERLQAYATAWTQPNANVTTSNLTAVDANLSGNITSGQWFLPQADATQTPPTSYRFDILGRDLSPTSTADPVFCVALRLTPLVPGNGVPSLVRADVRVLWPRDLGTPPTGAFCAANDANVIAPSPDPAVYHALYVTTALKENPAQ